MVNSYKYNPIEPKIPQSHYPQNHTGHTHEGTEKKYRENNDNNTPTKQQVNMIIKINALYANANATERYRKHGMRRFTCVPLCAEARVYFYPIPLILYFLYSIYLFI